MKCASCGREMDESLKFCEGCGAPVVKAQAAGPPPPPPVPPPSPKTQAQVPPPPAAAPAKKSGKGKCGCIALVALVVLLVLLGLCVAGGVFFWKRGLKDKINQYLHPGNGDGNASITVPVQRSERPGQEALLS